MNGGIETSDGGQAAAESPRDVLDHRAVAWERVRWTSYLVHQHFRYEYPTRVHDLRHRLVIVPPDQHGDQRLITHRLDVSSPTSETHRERDAFGNLVVSVAVDHVAGAIEFIARILIERDATAGPIAVPPETYADPALREPSPLTAPDDDLRSAAASIDGDDWQLACRINAWVFAEMRYAHGVTGVRTSAAAAFAQRSGVCQDYAHVMLALCRLRGLPARYVSGHLLGEGGTHAWVEVLLPDRHHPGRFVACPFDPTHGTRPGLNYVTVAVGRDYGDVAPTSGTYRSPVAGHLVARKQVGVTAVEYFPGYPDAD